MKEEQNPFRVGDKVWYNNGEQLYLCRITAINGEECFIEDTSIKPADWLCDAPIHWRLLELIKDKD